MDPDRYLPSARAPVLVQCGRFDLDDNVRACPEVHSLAGGTKRLIGYEEDHIFTSLEAIRDRLAWLEQPLKLQPLGPIIYKFFERQSPRIGSSQGKGRSAGAPSSSLSPRTNAGIPDSTARPVIHKFPMLQYLQLNRSNVDKL